MTVVRFCSVAITDTDIQSRKVACLFNYLLLFTNLGNPGKSEVKITAAIVPVLNSAFCDCRMPVIFVKNSKGITELYGLVCVKKELTAW
jgi:hypothetical protein